MSTKLWRGWAVMRTDGRWTDLEWSGVTKRNAIANYDAQWDDAQMQYKAENARGESMCVRVALVIDEATE